MEYKINNKIDENITQVTCKYRDVNNALHNIHKAFVVILIHKATENIEIIPLILLKD